jgi:archaemetzincin
MRPIRLVPVGPLEAGRLDLLAEGLTTGLDARCAIDPIGLDARFAFHPERRQYHATEMLARLHELHRGAPDTVLGVTAADLYIPILTFVFGEAQNPGACAIVSTHRLRQEFYGLPADDALLAERLLKEAIHEIGHTVGLVHCEDHTCAMASSHSVELIDLKEARLCAACRKPKAGVVR